MRSLLNFLVLLVLATLNGLVFLIGLSVSMGVSRFDVPRPVGLMIIAISVCASFLIKMLYEVMKE